MNAQRSAARQQYEQAGYVVFRNVLDAELVHEAKAHVAWLLDKNPGLRPEQLNTELVEHDPFWVRLVSDERLLDVAEQFIGPNIALFASHYICKPPFDGQAVLWHQDGSFWPLEPMEVVTLWLAIDPSLPENGCMRVIPGTHRQALHEMSARTDVANVLNMELDPSTVDAANAVDVVLNPGDVSVHHPNIIHGSEANTSPLSRCGLTIRYIPTSTRILPKAWPSAFLLRGEAVPRVNTYLPRPRYVAGEHMPFKGCHSWT